MGFKGEKKHAHLQCGFREKAQNKAFGEKLIKNSCAVRKMNEKKKSPVGKVTRPFSHCSQGQGRNARTVRGGGSHRKNKT